MNKSFLSKNENFEPFDSILLLKISKYNAK